MPERAAKSSSTSPRWIPCACTPVFPRLTRPTSKSAAKAAVTLQEFPGEKFIGMVVRTAEAIDPATRTLLTEVDVVNKDGRLLPGSFGQVHFAVGANVQKLTVPVNAMLFRTEGARVAVVGPDHKVELRPLNIGRDYGTTLEVLGGLAVSDQIVINPPDSLENGQQVNVAQPSPGAAGAIREPDRKHLVTLDDRNSILRPQPGAHLRRAFRG